MNEGIKPIDIEKVRVRASQVDRLEGPAAKAEYVDMCERLNSQSPEIDRSYTADGATHVSKLVPPLVARYASGMSYDWTFEWLVPEDPSKRFYVRVEPSRLLRNGSRANRCDR